MQLSIHKPVPQAYLFSPTIRLLSIELYNSSGSYEIENGREVKEQRKPYQSMVLRDSFSRAKHSTQQLVPSIGVAPDWWVLTSGRASGSQ